MLEKSSKMSVREAMIDLVGYAPRHGEQHRWLEKVAKSVQGVSFRTARSLWLGEITKEDHLAIVAIKREAMIKKAKREAQMLASQYEAIAEGLRAKNENLHSAEIDLLVRAAVVIRNLDRTGA
jgi:hypothetical protein